MSKRKKHSIELEEKCMEKLFQFVRSFMERKTMKNIPIKFQFKGLKEEHATAVFNIWFRLDYVTPFGKRMIEHFLEEESNNLSKEEKEILRELNKSFISIYKVMDMTNGYLIIKDLINNEQHILLYDEGSRILKGHVFSGRIVNILGNLELIGVTTHFDPVVEEIIVENINKHYNNIRAHRPQITMKEFLKNYSNIVYEVLDNILRTFSDEEEEIPLEVKQQLDKFAKYMFEKERLKESTVKKHTNKLFEFYWYYLKEIGKTLYDIDDDMIDTFIMNGIVDNFMRSKSDLSSYITSIKKFAKHLNKIGIIGKKDYGDILEVAKNKDYYIRKFEEYEANPFEDIDDFHNWLIDEHLEDVDISEVEAPIDYDEELAEIIKKYNYNEIHEFIQDYNKYIDYLSNNNVKATKINKHINRKDLLKLNKIITNGINIEKRINQKHIPILHLFYKFSVDKGIITVDDKNYINIEKKLEEYNELSKEEKTSAFINYIWNEANWREFADDNMEMIEREYELRDEFIKVLSKLKVEKYYDSRDIRRTYKEENDISFRYPMAVAHVFNTKIIRYFSYIGLLDIQYKKVKSNYDLMFGDDIDKIQISKLGKEAFKYLYKQNQDIDMSNVINLFDYKR